MDIAQATEDEIEQRRQLRARKGALWISLVVPCFALVDWLTLERFSWATLAVRLVWTALVVSMAWPLPVSRSSFRNRVRLTVAGSAFAIGAIAHLSGGSSSLLFAALPALPVVAVMLLQDDGVAALYAAFGALASMAVVLVLEGAEPVLAAGWLLFGLGMAVVGLLGAKLSLQRQQEALATEQARLDAVARLAMSERRRGESERLALLGQLAAGVAHEVNNPLAFLKSNLHFLAAELPREGDPELAQALEDAKRGADRIEQIVRDLRSFSRSEADREDAFSPRELVEEALRIASLRLNTVARAEADYEPDLPLLTGPRGRLMQVLINLLVNAADALEEVQPRPPHPLVRVRCSCEDGAVVLRVEDNGPGLPPEAVERLFQPFFTTKPAGKGTGLGLALSREYVERFGGTLTAENRPEGGACFTARLPRAPVSQ